MNNKKSKSFKAVYALLITALIVLFGVSFLCVRYSTISPSNIPLVLLNAIFPNIPQTWTQTEAAVILEFRLPRIFAAILVGASLSMSGATYQVLFSNPIASPDTLGVSNGASLGAVIGILIGAKACHEFDICVEMTSDTHLTGTDRVAEVASKVPADLYVNVQGDEPLIQPSEISRVFQPFLAENCNVQISNLMTKIIDPVEVCNPTVVKAITRADNIGLYLTRAAAPYPKGTLSYTFYKQLGIYAFTKKAIAFEGAGNP